MVGNAVPPRLAKQLAIALKEQLSHVTVSSKKEIPCSILVGYYRSDEQLRLTKENRVYYVRTGFRPGAMQIQPGSGSPEYLLLHKGNNIELFRLKKGDPIVMYRSELENLGFTPHGDVYLAFQIEESLGLDQKSFSDDFIKSVKYSTVPFVAFL